MAENAKIIWDFLLNQGFNKIGVSAIMGNLQCESGLLPNNLQNNYNTTFGMSDEIYTTSVDNGSYTNFVHDSAGYGLAQWTYWSRKQNLLNYAKSKGKSIGDLNTQLEFLVKELKESFPSLFTLLKNATSIASATSQFMIKYEMPADQSASAQQVRINSAQLIYNQFINTTTDTNTEAESVLGQLASSNILLRQGATGTNVKILQEALIKLGYSCGPDGADGDFGINTYKAVVSFQKAEKIEVDGIAGPDTFAHLSKAIKNNAEPAEEVIYLQFGSKGDKVKELQEKLISLGYSCGPDGADGDFGLNTRSALIKFQADNDLSQTGIADNKVFEKFNSATSKAPETSSDAIKKLLEIAQSQLGYHEKASNNYLDDFTANSGSANWTKYARDLNEAGYYNGDKNGYAWCDLFVDWCFYMLANKDAYLAQKVECQTGDGGAGCLYSAQYYRNQNRYSSTPNVGDQVFFGPTGAEYHTGIVEKVFDNYIVTIEGNIMDQVLRQKYTIGESSINGYGHPKYELLSVASTPSNTQSTIQGQGKKVRITADVLNIRHEAGTQYDAVGVYVKDTICELSEIRDGWGKTNRGWICLDYVQEV